MYSDIIKPHESKEETNKCVLYFDYNFINLPMHITYQIVQRQFFQQDIVH